MCAQKKAKSPTLCCIKNLVLTNLCYSETQLLGYQINQNRKVGETEWMELSGIQIQKQYLNHSDAFKFIHLNLNVKQMTSKWTIKWVQHCESHVQRLGETRTLPVQQLQLHDTSKIQKYRKVDIKNTKKERERIQPYIERERKRRETSEIGQRGERKIFPLSNPDSSYKQ